MGRSTPMDRKAFVALTKVVFVAAGMLTEAKKWAGN